MAPFFQFESHNYKYIPYANFFWITRNKTIQSNYENALGQTHDNVLINNDIFFIRNLNTEIYSQSIMTIYNRWGLVVYSKAGYGIDNEWWDGNTTYENRAVTDGVYYYILEIFNNVTEELEKHTGELNIFKSNSSSSNETQD